MQYILRNRQYLFLLFLVVLSGFFQNCDPDDEGMEPMRKYHCPRERFTNDCIPYDSVGGSTGYGYAGMRAESITFVPGNSDQILFSEWDGDDAAVPAKVVLYDWSSKIREVLVEKTPVIFDYDITNNRMVCGKMSSGPIIYFQLDSPSTTVHEVPGGHGIVRDPVWLNDGKKIAYLQDSQDLRFNLMTFTIATRESEHIPVRIAGIRPLDLILTSMSPQDQLLAIIAKKGFYRVDFHDLTNADLFMPSNAVTLPAGTVSILKNPSRMYYAGPWLISYGEGGQEYGIRDLCHGDEQIHSMDVSDDEKFIVYMFDFPLKLQGGVQIRGSKIRIIDIENCKEYEINPFE